MLWAVGERSFARLSVVDVEINPVELDRVLLLGTSDGCTDDVANGRIGFEEELSVDGALDLTVGGVGADPSGSVGHGAILSLIPSSAGCAEMFPKKSK